MLLYMAMEVLHLPIGKNKTRLAVALDIGTAQAIKDMAAKEKRSASAMLAILIAEALENRKKPQQQHAFIRGAEYNARAMARRDNKEESPDA